MSDRDGPSHHSQTGGPDGNERAVDRRGVLKLLALPAVAAPLGFLSVAGGRDDESVPNWLEYGLSPRVRWVTEDSYSMSPGVGDGALYVGDRDGVLRALSTADGREQWTFDTGIGLEGDFAAQPTVTGDTVYVPALDGPLYAVDTANGSERWRVETDGQVDTRPAVTDDTVCVASGRTVHAFDSTDGRERWRLDTGHLVDGSPAVVDGSAYVGSDETLYALSAADGTQRWTQDTFDAVTAGPTVDDGTVYVGRRDGVHALSAADGTERWVAEDVVATERMAVANGRLYATALAGPLVALDTANGRVAWRFEGADAMWTQPVVADGTVYVGAGDTKRIHAIDAADGSERWSFPAVGEPVVADGSVYVNAKTALFALKAD